jgi:ubiquinone/menaquinone biosynthesis C-methylase UbiE
LTAGTDQRGRRLVVDHAVDSGDSVLDCGAGTGSTFLLALKKAGPAGIPLWPFLVFVAETPGS